MTPTPPRVLLYGPAASDLDGVLDAVGYAATRADRPVDLPSFEAVVVDVGSRPSSAVAFTRLCRAEGASRPVPIVWVLTEPAPDATVAGLDAGADAVLVRPFVPAVLAAQLRAGRRVRDLVTAHADRVAATSLVNDELRSAYAEAAAAAELARRVRAAAYPAELPSVGPVRFGVAHHDPAAVGLYGVARFDEHRVGFWLADAGGRRSITGELVRLAVLLAVPPTPTPPPAVLDRVNGALIRLALDPPPLVGLGSGVIDTRTGSVTVARAGLPPAVYLPADGEPESWVGPGPFLGAFDAEFPPHEGALRSGDKLVLATGGEPARVKEAAGKHRDLPAADLAGAVARELGCETALAVEVLVALA